MDDDETWDSDTSSRKSKGPDSGEGMCTCIKFYVSVAVICSICFSVLNSAIKIRTLLFP